MRVWEQGNTVLLQPSRNKLFACESFMVAHNVCPPPPEICVFTTYHEVLEQIPYDELILSP
jgi:hypothetical protein